MNSKEMEKQQLLRDPNIEPTIEVISYALGAANNAYDKFIDGLRSCDIVLDWRYYNDGKAWLGKALYKWTTNRGTQKEKTAFWLSVWDGFFKVTFYIPEKVRADALNLPVDSEIKKIIESSKQMGKLKFFLLIFNLCSDELFDDIYTIADFRKTIK